MTSNNILLRAIFLLGFFWIASCSADKQEVDSRLPGKWQLIEGWRNNRQSPSLENVFFEFFADGNMRSNFNFNGSSEAGTFQMEDRILRQRNGEFELEYTIESISDSILILNTILMEAEFRLLLKKEPSAQ